MAREPQRLRRRERKNITAGVAHVNASFNNTMNAKLNRLIDAEVGEDVGQMLPGGVDAGWIATPAINDI